LANVINIDKQIEESIKNLPDYNYMLGRTLMQPFKPANSGSRALMYAVHSEHLMVPTNGEVPNIQTGFETEFGRSSSSYIAADSDLKVLYKIPKFEFNPNHYYLIVQDMKTGVFDVLERVTYKHSTESYGYIWDSSRMDRLKVGDVIHEGDIIKTSIGFDEYGNKMNGVNLVTMYLSCAQNMEDSIIISESASKKLETSLVKNTSVPINDNDILLNLYGDANQYKTFPDVGEKVKNGIFCSIRRMENENVLYSLSQQRLRDIMISDRNILMDGTVADIDVYCNNPDALGDSHYNQQLYFYYKQSMEFCRKVNDIVGPIKMDSNCKTTNRLNELYARCRDTIAGKQFFKDRVFNNVSMEVTVVQQLLMEPGDKMCDRYGGKGIVSKIVKDEMMPVLDNGKRVEVIKNQSTCINRENVGQLHEQSLSFISMRLIDYFKTGVFSYPEMAEMWYEFVSMIDKDEAEHMLSCFNLQDEWESRMFMESVFDDDAIIISSPPFTTPVNIDLIADIYKKFPFIKPYTVKVPMEDSNGNIRYVKTRRPMVIGKIYNYRLKQYAEEKFSVTSLSATNLKNLNTRSKANKVYETKFTKTPIMFGPMESGDLAHLGMQYVVMNLMLYSSSPQARRLFEQLLIGDPYNIDIKLDKDSKNRNAEIINALFKTMGIKLVFEKIPKQKKFLCLNVMCKVVPPRLFKGEQTRIREVMGRFDELQLQYNAALQDKRGKNMVGRVMCKEVGENVPEHVTKARRELIELKERESDDSTES
jgi:DNA-directed RNA polymerase beta subunit